MLKVYLKMDSNADILVILEFLIGGRRVRGKWDNRMTELLDAYDKNNKGKSISKRLVDVEKKVDHMNSKMDLVLTEIEGIKLLLGRLSSDLQGSKA